jgi:V/A-type H+/Na+-transporting ATPase subunit I
MAIAKMKLVNIVGRLKNFDTVVRSCCLNGDFHPEQSSIALDDVEEFIPIEDFNPYTRTLQRAVDIGVHSDIMLHFSSFDKLNMSDVELEDYIEKTETEINVLGGKVRDLTHDIARLEQGLTQLSHIRSLKISLDDVFSCKFFHFRFGRLPKDSYPKLEICDDSESVFFFPLEEDKEYYWGFYVVLTDVCDKIDELFTSLYFERINILEEAHGTPDEAMTAIRRTLAEKNAVLVDAKAEVSKYWREHQEKFLTAYSKIKYLSDSFDLRKYASKCGDNFYVFGWVPESGAESFAKRFQKLPDVDCVLESSKEAENVTPPTHLINNKISKPFEMFTGMYGLPSYDEIDPTSFMAIAYTLFFGIMFGDLGQGLCIFLIGLFCKYRKMLGAMSGILVRIGISSAIFGFLYNSVFGYEGKLPITILPVHENKNVGILLIAAVALGVIIIIICMLLNITNAIRQKKFDKLWFDANGVAGLAFYVSILVAGGLLVGLQKNILSPLFIAFLIVLPLLLIFFKEPLMRLIERKKEIIPGSKPEFFMTAFFEVFEVLLSYMSNTISFMRVGAYILSHAGMMTAVFAIGKICGNGNIVAVIIGNIFVLALEGLVVGIQGIRLHFYEMFSRFYEGDGKPYEPAKIDY